MASPPGVARDVEEIAAQIAERKKYLATPPPLQIMPSPLAGYSQRRTARL